MTYPYDGIRSMIEYYKNYIDYLKKQIEELKKENEEYKQLLGIKEEPKQIDKQKKK